MIRRFFRPYDVCALTVFHSGLRGGNGTGCYIHTSRSGYPAGGPGQGPSGEYYGEASHIAGWFPCPFCPGTHRRLGICRSDSPGRRAAKRVEQLPRSHAIIIYCGCCPWTKCPNIRPAYQALVEMGFTEIKTLYLKDNFGADWVSQGYPTAKGE
jgi:hypothetical protein